MAEPTPPAESSSSFPSDVPVGELHLAGKTPDAPIPETDPTVGYKLNHFMMRIQNPERSLHFYKTLMGMRTIFVTNPGPFTIYYLGYPQTPEHRADPKAFGEETMATLAHTLGLLELYHVHGSEKEEDGYYETGNRPPALGFGHMGFTVPDVEATLERLRGEGVPVFKELGVTSREKIPLSEWEKQKGIGLGEPHPIYKAVFDQIAFVQDPDGYLVELVPQNMKI